MGAAMLETIDERNHRRMLEARAAFEAKVQAAWEVYWNTETAARQKRDLAGRSPEAFRVYIDVEAQAARVRDTAVYVAGQEHTAALHACGCI